MKIILLVLSLFVTFNSQSQTLQPADNRSQLQKEDSNNQYNQSNITTLDLLQALELASIRVHKFNIGTFDKEYRLQIFADEYTNGKLIKTDTLIDYTNDYGYWVDEQFYQGFIDQLKVFTKSENNKSTLNIKTYSASFYHDISLPEMTHPKQYYTWRAYQDTQWKLDQNVPLLIFASSWYDKEVDGHRFCSVVYLKSDDKKTTELLTNSPNYIIINYKISQPKQ